MNQDETCHLIHLVEKPFKLVCFLNETKCQLIQITTNIELVTCTFCNYYFFHPEAKRMEKEYREKYGRNS